MSYAGARSGTCFNCGQPGHVVAECPAITPTQPKPKALSDDEIRGRITRLYQPANSVEMDALVGTWRDNYSAGLEYPEAPRYPPGFVALLAARNRGRLLTGPA